MNILDSCTFYSVDSSKLTPEQKINYGEDENFILSLEDIHLADISDKAVDWDSAEFDENELEYILTDKIGRHPHYLVFACGCRWNGVSGYMFTDEITKTCERSYDISLDLLEEGNNAIKCKESSHDVPMGSTTIIVGITEEEYEQLEDADFDKIEKFALSKF